VGPAVSGGKRKGAVPVQKSLLGCGLLAVLGRIWPRGPFFIFFLFSSFPFLFFLISFISFAYLVQIASNQLCKVSKIQINNTKQ
jgi:hypothetical protein